MPQQLMSGRTISISGKIIASLRKKMAFSQDEFAPMAGLKPANLKRIEQSAKPVSVYLSTARKLATSLNVAIDDLAEQSQIDAAIDLLLDTLEPANIQHAPKQIPSIPEWTAEIACGHWIDCATIAMDMDNDVQADTARRGMFIVRVMGDSMKPTYKPGNRVLFRVVRLDDEPLRIGADYYWQNSDGQCTLKRLKSIGEDEYTLAPLNRKYKPLKLAKQMLAKVAIVETIVTAPWE